MIRTALALTQPMESVFLAKKNHRLSVNFFIVILGSLLLAVAAQVSLPISPIYLTLLDMAAFFCGMAFGLRLSCLMILTYYLLGCLGLPVFENGQSGMSVLLGFNLGYYLGLIPGVALSAYLTEHGWGRHLFSAFMAAGLGMAIMFGLGATNLAMHYNWTFAWTYGLSPFIGISVLKVIILSLVIPQIWTAVSR